MLRRIPITQQAILGAMMCCVLSGCESFHAQPLPDARSAENRLERIQVDPRTMPSSELAAHRFDPSDGLDITETAMLAVANNPDLRLARDDLGIARAQAFSAGLLPDPQLGIANDFPSPAGHGLTSAFNYGLSTDVTAILLRSSHQHAAQAAAAQTDLGLLWQEWQTVALARQLFLKAVYLERTLPLLEQIHRLAQQRYDTMAQATAAGNLPADTLTAALSVAQDSAKQLADAQRLRVQTRHDLNALLGLAGSTELRLVDSQQFVALGDAEVQKALLQLPERRPDLLALKAGYNAQEEKYRAAILGQFPSLTLGFVRARDTSNIYTSGFQANLSLPIFNRNRGNITIEKATRQRLRDEYQNRINLAYGEVDRLQADSQVLISQNAELETKLPELEKVAVDTRQALAEHNVTLATYTDAQLAWLSRKAEAAALRESLAEQRVSLQAMLGGELPDAYSNDLRWTNNNGQ